LRSRAYPDDRGNHTNQGNIYILEEGIVFPLKSEYDRINHSLEGVRERRDVSALDLLDSGDVIAHVVQPKTNIGL
ncbi:MAG: hypothetical protein ACKPKO_39615, partial [Candidatus Fonsibacter sp.]